MFITSGTFRGKDGKVLWRRRRRRWWWWWMGWLRVLRGTPRQFLKLTTIGLIKKGPHEQAWYFVFAVMEMWRRKRRRAFNYSENGRSTRYRAALTRAN